MTDPTHAVITDGTVTTVALMDAVTAQEWRDNGFVEQLWPGGELVDVTDADPMPSTGWTHHADTQWPWRPAQPGPEHAWSDEDGRWVDTTADAPPADQPATPSPT